MYNLGCFCLHGLDRQRYSSHEEDVLGAKVDSRESDLILGAHAREKDFTHTFRIQSLSPSPHCSQKSAAATKRKGWLGEPKSSGAGHVRR